MRDDFRARLAARLRAAREQIGYSQAAAARLAGLPHRETLTEIEAGRRKVSTSELVRLAGVYALGASDLLNMDAPLPLQPTVLACRIDESAGGAPAPSAPEEEPHG